MSATRYCFQRVENKFVKIAGTNVCDGRKAVISHALFIKFDKNKYTHLN